MLVLQRLPSLHHQSNCLPTSEPERLLGLASALGVPGAEYLLEYFCYWPIGHFSIIEAKAKWDTLHCICIHFLT